MCHSILKEIFCKNWEIQQNSVDSIFRANANSISSLLVGTAASIYLIALVENWLTGSLHSTHFSPFHILEKYLRHFSPFHILNQVESNKIQSLVLAWKRTDEDAKRPPNSSKERLSLSLQSDRE